MPVHTGHSVAPPERRLHASQRLDAIVYLDIGADNGGIVLNLSEKGMGFQAVGPLDKESDLRLRIKLPGSKTRIDVTAHIAWISESKRQAGVRFLDAQSEGPVQIQEWIRSQAPPRAPWEESWNQVEEESSQAAAFQTPCANARVEPECGDAAIAATSHDESRGELTLDWSAPISRTGAMAIPLPRDAPVKPPEPIEPGVESKTNSTPAPVNGIVAVPAATDRRFV